MVLVDSNVIIYGSQPGYQSVRAYLSQEELAISKITLIEVLGFHALEEAEVQKLEQLFASCYQYDVSDEVIKQAIALRQQRKMSLGDAIIATTAIHHQLTLVTANKRDLDWIADLHIYNPVSK